MLCYLCYVILTFKSFIRVKSFFEELLFTTFELDLTS